jgi:phage baseplate assembly protein W
MIDYTLTNANGEQAWVYPMDIDEDANGAVQTNTGLKLVDQLLQKDFMTEFGSSKVNPSFGSSFPALIGAKINIATISILIMTEVVRIVSRVKNLLVQNPNTTPDERIQSLDNVFVDTIQGNPTQLAISTSVSNQSGQNTGFTQPIRIM